MFSTVSSRSGFAPWGVYKPPDYGKETPADPLHPRWLRRPVSKREYLLPPGRPGHERDRDGVDKRTETGLGIDDA